MRAPHLRCAKTVPRGEKVAESAAEKKRKKRWGEEVDSAFSAFLADWRLHKRRSGLLIGQQRRGKRHTPFFPFAFRGGGRVPSPGLQSPSPGLDFVSRNCDGHADLRRRKCPVWKIPSEKGGTGPAKTRSVSPVSHTGSCLVPLTNRRVVDQGAAQGGPAGPGAGVRGRLPDVPQRIVRPAGEDFQPAVGVAGGSADAREKDAEGVVRVDRLALHGGKHVAVGGGLAG